MEVKDREVRAAAQIVAPYVPEGRPSPIGLADDPASAITDAFSPFRRRRDGGGVCRDELRNYIAERLKPGEPLRCVIPGFPCKSVNPDSVFGLDADAAEAAAVQELERLASAINDASPDGAEIWILQDADLFPDTPVIPSAGAIDRYSAKVRSFTSHPSLHWVRVGELLPSSDGGGGGIAAIEDRYFEPLGELHDRLSSEPDLLRTYRALHAFLENEAPKTHGQSRRAHRRAISAATLDQLRRSRALARIIDDEFDGYLRLSARGYSAEKERIGINLIRGNHEAGMPWWNCLAVRRDGSLDLVKRAEGIERGYEIAEGPYGPYFQEKS